MRPEVLEKIDSGKDKGRIHLNNMHIEDQEIQEIMQSINALKSNISLLNFDGNNLSDEGAIILSKFLVNYDHLSELSLQFNNIGKQGAISLFGLKKNQADLDI